MSDQPTTWIRIFDRNGGATEIAYNEQVEEKLRAVLSNPPNERDELLELPFVEDETTSYFLHSSDLVSFFVSTPRQREAYREHDIAREQERQAFAAQHPDFSSE